MHSSFDGLIQEDIDLSDINLAVYMKHLLKIITELLLAIWAIFVHLFLLRGTMT